MAPGVTTFGTGSHTSVSSGFIFVDCCAEIVAAVAKRAASAMDLENCMVVILDEDTSCSLRKVLERPNQIDRFGASQIAFTIPSMV